MKYTDIIKIDLTDNEILEAVKHARKESFLDNLRERNEFVALDSKIRGYMGEIFLRKLFHNVGIEMVKTNALQSWGGDSDFEIKTHNSGNLIVECKTSLIPDSMSTLKNVISKCDIKILKRESDFTEIPIDIHIQIYFNALRKQRDSKLSQIIGQVKDYSDKQIIEKLGLRELEGFFVAWIDKEELNKYMNLIDEADRVWHFSLRDFWKCPLTWANAPKDFIEYLNKK